MLIPLDHAAPLTVQVRLQAFTYPGATPQTLALTVNGRTFGPVPVPDRWETLEFATGIDAWRGRVNRLQLEFGARAHAGGSGTGRRRRARSPPRWTTFACRSADGAGLGSGPKTKDLKTKSKDHRVRSRRLSPKQS